METFGMAPTIQDENGMFVCEEHRREMCHECKINFVPINKAARKEAQGKDANFGKIFQQQAEKNADIIRAMALDEAAGEARGVDIAEMLSGGAATQRKYEEKAETCAVCGKKGKVLRCAKCKYAAYCGKECQRADWASHKKECKKIAKQIENEQWFMGNVPILPPGDPRWANPTEEDKALARRLLDQGKTPEEVTNGGNPMLGGWMLGLEMEKMLAGL